MNDQQWQQFFEAMRPLMPPTYEHRRVRRVRVAYWGHTPLHGNANGDHVYLAIHKGLNGVPASTDGDYFLAFRVAVDNRCRNYRIARRNRMNGLLMQVVTGHPWAPWVNSPQQFGIGGTMAFGVTTNQDCWLALSPNGTPDLNVTVQNLQTAGDILQGVWNQYAA